MVFAGGHQIKGAKIVRVPFSLRSIASEFGCGQQSASRTNCVSRRPLRHGRQFFRPANEKGRGHCVRPLFLIYEPRIEGKREFHFHDFAHLADRDQAFIIFCRGPRSFPGVSHLQLSRGMTERDFIRPGVSESRGKCALTLSTEITSQ